jgi:hypothetical protein
VNGAKAAGMADDIILTHAVRGWQRLTQAIRREGTFVAVVFWLHLVTIASLLAGLLLPEPASTLIFTVAGVSLWIFGGLWPAIILGLLVKKIQTARQSRGNGMPHE